MIFERGQDGLDLLRAGWRFAEPCRDVIGIEDCRHALVGIPGDELGNALIGLGRAHDEFRFRAGHVPEQDGDGKARIVLRPDRPLPGPRIPGRGDAVGIAISSG